jgi:hypothetical protein
VLLVWLKEMGVAGLQQVCQLRWYYHGKDACRKASLHYRRSEMQGGSIHEQDGLELVQKRLQDKAELPHDASLHPRIVPSTLLPNKLNIRGAGRLQARKFPF